MPENRVHAATTCRIRVNSERHRKAAELHGDGRTANRLMIMACLTLLLVSSVFGRLGYLQLFLHSEYLAKAQRQQQHVIEITPKRGAIYDRNMHPLAMSVPVQSAFAVPTEVKDVAMASRLLSGVLGVQQDLIREKLDSGATFVWIQRKLTPEKAGTYTLGSAIVKGSFVEGMEGSSYTGPRLVAVDHAAARARERDHDGRGCDAGRSARCGGDRRLEPRLAATRRRTAHHRGVAGGG